MTMIQDVAVDDEDTDLDTADRGDNLTPAKTDEKKDAKPDAKADGDEGEKDEDDDKDSGQPRDKQGRFAKDGKPDPEDDEDDGEEDEEDDEGEESDGSRKNYPIRFNKMKQQRDTALSRAEAAEAKLRELGQQSGATDKGKEDPVAKLETELDALYLQAEEARADGDTKKAAALQRDIDSKNREIVEHKTRAISSTVSTKAQEAARYDTMLDVLEATVDKLDPNSDAFDPASVRLMDFHVQAYEKMGLSAPKALRQAAKLLFGVDPFDKRKPAKSADADDGEDKKNKADAKKPEKKEEKKVDVGKAVDTMKKQPPDASDRGVNKDDTKINPRELSEEEFDALPESKKAQLRGDLI